MKDIIYITREKPETGEYVQISEEEINNFISKYSGLADIVKKFPGVKKMADDDEIGRFIKELKDFIQRK